MRGYNEFDYLNRPRAQRLYLDFVYRIESSDYAGLSATDVIFQIRCQLHYSEHSAHSSSTQSTIDLPLSHYTSYVSSSPEESASILTFNHKSYAVFRIPVDVSSGDTINKIDFDFLKTSLSRRIFVRGLRVRTEPLEQLLHHQLDGVLDTKFNRIRAYLSQRGVWNKTLALTAGNEVTFQNFRACA